MPHTFGSPSQGLRVMHQQPNKRKQACLSLALRPRSPRDGPTGYATLER
eukprot:CAMPEP_0180316038 /NCGR_PEP_ID=MMETSP0988-20121125/33019_1 /TAXON_ID=697907 /ORGANISM="non described non described, Strain CCMP2293" /LENGTH=48 /DNA_ID= /DNA_START= /DNA_END= /DNA_ORIENTATION=